MKNNFTIIIIITFSTIISILLWDLISFDTNRKVLSENLIKHHTAWNPLNDPIRFIIFLSLPYFDHIHRFLPALTRRHGGSVISHIVSHRNRSSGVSKYSNWQRFRVGLIDLYGVSWLIKRSSFPIKLKDEDK